MTNLDDSQNVVKVDLLKMNDELLRQASHTLSEHNHRTDYAGTIPIQNQPTAFPLLCLPAELRLRIYAYILPSSRTIPIGYLRDLRLASTELFDDPERYINYYHHHNLATLMESIYSHNLEQVAQVIKNIITTTVNERRSSLNLMLACKELKTEFEYDFWKTMQFAWHEDDGTNVWIQTVVENEGWEIFVPRWEIKKAKPKYWGKIRNLVLD